MIHRVYYQMEQCGVGGEEGQRVPGEVGAKEIGKVSDFFYYPKNLIKYMDFVQLICVSRMNVTVFLYVFRIYIWFTLLYFSKSEAVIIIKRTSY